MDDREVYVVGNDSGVVRMFKEMEGYKLVGFPDYADIVVFTGGADVEPRLYGHKLHPTTGFSSARDDEDIEESDLCGSEQLKVGICRGAQFLCVMNGGTLYQDVDRHAIYGTHTCLYRDEKGQEWKYDVTSTHHQMQNPYVSQSGEDLSFELWGSASRCTYRDGEKFEQVKLNNNAHPDVEIVYWSDSHTLGFQPHPEYGVESCLNLFKTCLNRAMERKN